ncbi:hypothetical protein CVT25_002272 [Psilocybe cyanescens]|uniref:Calcineurin-like phosphoesterase domain-containing protein n=1 Tax=Psilocybe cyanescens TaxID=93625 RepID=A0A409WKE5_PSICY|nr:hypothetical protein CVT25_002272 [Psilocybe cyanescens]
MLLTPSFVLGLLGSFAVVSACPDHEDGGHNHGHAHTHSRRATPSVPLPPPTRQLEWGDINFIHTTDSHGWLLGHQKASFPEPNYSGDFGDFASFVAHMKELALERDTDLLLIDSGDLHDGTGLTDGFPPGGIDAHDANQFIKQLPYDVMAIGKHQNFAPSLKGRYLSSNVNITLLNEAGQVVTVPNDLLNSKPERRKVTSLGVLFDFTGNDHNTTVQKVADMVKETWFTDAIQEEPDFFLLVGHMPVSRDDWPLVFNAIRAVHSTTPILIFGGHTHIRDCLQLDGRSMSLESGRYMETVGWLSAKLDKNGSNKNITFSRRYLDPNRVTFEFHSKKNEQNFDTPLGQSITKGLNALAKRFGLSFQFGTAPHDFTISRSSYPSEDSLPRLFIENAVPVALAINNTRASIPNIIITNTGSLRFDIYAGEFTKNDQLTVSPFVNGFLYIPDVPFSVANQIVPALNNADENEKREFHGNTAYKRSLEEADKKYGVERRAAPNLTLGYVTSDSCPGVGDDIIHSPLPSFSLPDFIGSVPPSVADDAPIDLVFLDFNEPDVLQILNAVQDARNYTTADVASYSPVKATEVLGFFILGLLGSFAAVSACSDHEDGHAHDHAKRATPSVPLPPPSRQLDWGDINIIHTTDSHGWLLGHQKASFPEPNYSGTFGDFASFVTHMKELAIERDTDLLLVDSGDLHDGTGLTDGFPTGGVDAHDANQFIKQLPYDVMAIGNHELYIYANTLDMHQNFAPSLKGRYLSSNVNITLLNEKGQVVTVPVGERFAKFKTRKGRKVTSLGVLFDFTGNDHNTTVQKVSNMVKESWFADAIKEEPDFFLLVGHMPVARDDWPLVFNAVRAVHPTTPILILGGHTHIRDCRTSTSPPECATKFDISSVQLDGRSISLESGRYMETIGWLSAKLDQKVSKKNITFSRRYLDPNRVTFEFHTRKNNFNFDTLQGQSITKGLNSLATKFDLSFQFGTAPHDFTISQAPYPSNNSLLSLFIENAVPVALAINNTRASIPNIMITNTGSQRFDIYAGPFTKNDQLTASPFADAFLFIADVPFSVASQVLPALNNAGANERREILEARERELYGRGRVDAVYNRWLEEQDRRSGIERRAAQNLTLGYVTTDSCPGVGDDILHAPLPFHSTPDFIGSIPPTVADDAPIDLVFVDFIESQLLQILNSVQSAKTFSTADVASYSPILANEALGLYAQSAWN